MRFLFLSALLLVAACGVPTDDGPRAIPTDRVPPELLSTSTTTPPVTEQLATVEIDVFMLRDMRLSLVKRNIIAPPNAGNALAGLLQGPTAAESADGVRNTVDGQSGILGVQTNGNVAIVNVSTAFGQLSPSAQTEALAQIVYTVTGLAQVEGVQVSREGEVQAVPRGDGSRTTDPLTRDDYGNLAP